MSLLGRMSAESTLRTTGSRTPPPHPLRRVRHLLVDRGAHRLKVKSVIRRAEPRHREVLIGVRVLPLDPGGAGGFHEGGIPSNRALEVDEAPLVPVHPGKIDRLIEEGRSLKARLVRPTQNPVIAAAQCVCPE